MFSDKHGTEIFRMCKIVFNSIFRQTLRILYKVFVYCINFNHTPLDSQRFEMLYKMAPGSFINHNIYKHHQIKILFLILASSSCLRAPSSVSRVYHNLYHKELTAILEYKNGLFRKMSTHVIVLFKCAILPPEVFTPFLEQIGVVKMREMLPSLKCNCDLHFFPRQSHRNEL